MPNLLAHYGLQGPASRTVLAASEARWILTGCLLPDVPWILQRGVRTVLPGLVNPYDLRLYAVVQASLLFCLFLALALALVSTRPRTVFLTLALNAGLHLLLDGLQTKWASGVHLLAPFNWTTWSAGFFWPESSVTVLITLSGAVFLGWLAWRDRPAFDGRPEILTKTRGIGAVLALLVYSTLPVAFMQGAEKANAHFVGILRDQEDRAGRYLELDRADYVDRPEGDLVRTFAGERIHIRGVDLESSGAVSIQGRFLTPDTVAVSALHRHQSTLRDLASYVALVALVAVWARAVQSSRSGQGDEKQIG